MKNEYNGLISVIMPVFNSEETIEQAIESVLSQEYENFELIIVDDCSTDSSYKIIQDYAKVDKRIIVISTPRNSRSKPFEWEVRNNGLYHAKGELIAYLDSDNSWKKKYLNSLCIEFCNPIVQLVYCNSINHYPDGILVQIIDQELRNITEQTCNTAVFGVYKIDRTKLGFGQYIDTNEFIHRSSVFNRLGSLWHTFHPERNKINTNLRPIVLGRRHNDLDLVTRIIDMFGIESIRHVNENLVDYFYKGADRLNYTNISS